MYFEYISNFPEALDAFHELEKCKSISFAAFEGMNPMLAALIRLAYVERQPADAACNEAIHCISTITEETAHQIGLLLGTVLQERAHDADKRVTFVDDKGLDLLEAHVTQMFARMAEHHALNFSELQALMFDFYEEVSGLPGAGPFVDALLVGDEPHLRVLRVLRREINNTDDAGAIDSTMYGDRLVKRLREAREPPVDFSSVLMEICAGRNEASRHFYRADALARAAHYKSFVDKEIQFVVAHVLPLKRGRDDNDDDVDDDDDEPPAKRVCTVE